jgi:ribosome biogenesis protein YTM1
MTAVCICIFTTGKKWILIPGSDGQQRKPTQNIPNKTSRETLGSHTMASTTIQSETLASTASQQQPVMVTVRLTTKSIQYSIPNAKYLVPSDWKRFQLSQLINKVLQLSQSDILLEYLIPIEMPRWAIIFCDFSLHTAQPVPFDFVVNDQLLRTSVKNFIDSHGLSTESVLEIEYLESVLPPKFVQSLEHDDWISDLSISKQGSVKTS